MSTLPKWQIVHNALEQGAEVELDGMMYTIVDDVLSVRLQVFSRNQVGLLCPQEIRWIKSDMSFNDFKKVCEKLTQETIVDLAFQTAMSKMNNSPFQPLKWEDSIKKKAKNL